MWHVAAQPGRLLAHHQRQLAVGLQPEHAVDDVAAGLLQLAGPGDVGLLVEAGLDLDEGQHLLAGLGRLDQGVDDRGVAGGAVQRLLDRQHGRVGGGLLDEPLDAGGERVVGVVQQHLTVLQRREQVGRLGGLDLGQFRVRLGQEGRVLQRLPVEVGDREQPAQVERARQPEDLLLGDVELADQQLEHLVVDVVLDLEAHRRASDLAAQQLLLEGEQQVLGVVLLDLDVLVAGHPERAVADDLHAGEQLVEVAGDDVLQRHEPALAERRRTGSGSWAP